VPKKEGDQSKTTQTAHNPFGASTLAVNQQNPPAAGEEKKGKKLQRAIIPSPVRFDIKTLSSF
jgi:hypothetical protein